MDNGGKKCLEGLAKAKKEEDKDIKRRSFIFIIVKGALDVEKSIKRIAHLIFNPINILCFNILMVVLT